MVRFMVRLSAFRLIASVVRAAIGLLVPGMGPRIMLSLGMEKGYTQDRIGKMIVRSPRLGLGTAILSIVLLPSVEAKVLGVLLGIAVYVGNRIAAGAMLHSLVDHGWQ